MQPSEQNHVIADAGISETDNQFTQPVKNNPADPMDDRAAIISEAQDVLRGESRTAEELKNLLKKLESFDQFAYASEVLSKKIETEKKEGLPIHLSQYQRLAKYIYKDNSLPSSFKFDRALRGLNANDELAVTDKCETLGLAGAICKYKWFYDHQFNNLEFAEYYYKRGYEIWRRYLVNHREGDTSDALQNDDGYTAINCAYVNELMAVDKLSILGKVTGLNMEIKAQFEKSKEIRTFIIKAFVQEHSLNGEKPELKNPAVANWVIATLAEAYFGLRNYKASCHFIKMYISSKEVQEWEVRSFSRQIFSIAYLQLFQEKFAIVAEKRRLPLWEQLPKIVQEINREQIHVCINTFRYEKDKAVTAETHKSVIHKDGKLGLALSGGGFRASIFHIGVLAALAEKNILKDVEVLSCVSGGSIIGAYYYLKLKQLLETTHDDDITQQHYIELVKEIETDFLHGVQKNLRIRIFSNLGCNFKMLFNKNYSRTHRIGELYEEFLYKGMLKEKRDGEYVTVPGPIYMDQLFIKPLLWEGEDFSIINDNWKRTNKIPQLVLNATSVNTGHNWQFTASWMGEPPGNIQTDIDVKPRLRRMYYKDAPGDYKKFRLGYAVGASSCVPVLFEPMPMNDLYPGIDLQLIDGGLHDNQGIASLLEQECINMIISDASGQLPVSKVAAGNEAALFFRADNILQERLRELQFMDVKARSNTMQINKLLIVNLKNGLQRQPESWKFCKDPERKIFYADIEKNNNQLTDYGVDRNVQMKLSEIRTDLDSFNDTEAFGLMYSGYSQINFLFQKQGWQEDGNKKGTWNFTGIEKYVTIPEHTEEINHLLVAANKLAFKVIDVSKPVKLVVSAIGILCIVALIWLGLKFYYETIYSFHFTVQFLFYTLLIAGAGFVWKWLARLLDYKAFIRKYIILAGLVIFGFLFSNLYLAVFNGIYNKAGKLKRDAIE